MPVEFPNRSITFKGGVSEGRSAHILNQEVLEIKAVLGEVAGNKWNGTIMVIVALKRHYI